MASTQSNPSVYVDLTSVSNPGQHFIVPERVGSDDDSETDLFAASPENVPLLNVEERIKRDLVDEFNSTGCYSGFRRMSRKEDEVLPKIFPPPNGETVTSTTVFREYFSDSFLDRMFSSTNEYVRIKRAEMNNLYLHVRQRAWKIVTRGDIMIFIASYIYMRVVKVGDKRDYFVNRQSSLLPKHHALKGMSRERWEQIKRYLHIENP